MGFARRKKDIKHWNSWKLLQGFNFGQLFLRDNEIKGDETMKPMFAPASIFKHGVHGVPKSTWTNVGSPDGTLSNQGYENDKDLTRADQIAVVTWNSPRVGLDGWSKAWLHGSIHACFIDGKKAVIVLNSPCWTLYSYKHVSIWGWLFCIGTYDWEMLSVIVKSIGRNPRSGQYPVSLRRHMGVSKNRGIPKWMVYFMENPIKMDDLGVPLFLETPIETRSAWVLHALPSCYLKWFVGLRMEVSQYISTTSLSHGLELCFRQIRIIPCAQYHLQGNCHQTFCIFV